MSPWSCEQDYVSPILWEAAHTCSLSENSLTSIAEDGVSQALGRDKSNASRKLGAGRYADAHQWMVVPSPAGEDPLKILFGLDGLHFEVLLIRNGETLAALGPTAGEDLTAALGGHTCAEAVCLGAFSFVWLVRALHGSS